MPALDLATGRLLMEDKGRLFLSPDGHGGTLTALATPGHAANHLCFVWGEALFSGDHVMGLSTSVVAVAP